MTTPAKTQDDIPVSPFMGAILTASIEQVGETTDLLLESKDREIAEWKAAFAKLYDFINSANDSVDSAKIERILNRFNQKRSWAEPDTNSH